MYIYVCVWGKWESERRTWWCARRQRGDAARVHEERAEVGELLVGGASAHGTHRIRAHVERHNGRLGARARKCKGEEARSGANVKNRAGGGIGPLGKGGAEVLDDSLRLQVAQPLLTLESRREGDAAGTKRVGGWTAGVGGHRVLGLWGGGGGRSGGQE